jgi:hypothetical protein
MSYFSPLALTIDGEAKLDDFYNIGYKIEKVEAHHRTIYWTPLSAYSLLIHSFQKAMGMDILVVIRIKLFSSWMMETR